jgi:hypothetical protein
LLLHSGHVLFHLLQAAEGHILFLWKNHLTLGLAASLFLCKVVRSFQAYGQQ